MGPSTRIRRCFAQGWNAWKDLVFPAQCAWCHSDIPSATQRLAEGVFLCGECALRLVPKIWHSCPKCGGHDPSGLGSPHGCPSCKGASFHFDTVVTLGGYHTELRDVIFRMKRPQGEILALSLGRLLAFQRGDTLRTLQPEGIIPVPIYWRRRFDRGVNSPEFLAKALSKTLEIPLYRKVLVRIRNTQLQSGLTPRQRFENVRGAFRARRTSLLRGRRILLVDDVLTTGATCSEAARILKKAGVQLVAVAVVARAQGNPQNLP